MAWLSGWEHRLKLTVADTNVDGDLTNFPILVYLSTASGVGDVDVSVVFDELTSDANRKKIAVTTSDGETQCYVEIERWDDASEKAWLWVKVPSILASGGAVLYLYYDSSHADNTTYVGDTGDAAAQSVWDSNFIGVWHMGQDPNGDPSGGILDSTSNGYNGTPSGSMTSADLVDGLIGKAIDFDGSDDAIVTTCPGIGGAGDRTVEVVFKAAATAATGGMVFWGNSVDGTKANFTIDATTGALRTEAQGGNLIASTLVDDNTWRYGVFTFTGDNIDDVLHYLNGASDAEGSHVSIAWNTGSVYPVNFGRQYSSGYIYLPVILCEVRISDTVRSAAWIKATHYSNTDAIITFASEASWLGTWQKRIELTIDDTNVDSDLTNFPVLIYVSAASGIGDVDASAVFDELTSDGNRKKIAVTTADGQTQCYVEIERWDDASEMAWLWVKVPSILASGGAILYLYYDLAQSENTTYVGDTTDAVTHNVWDANHKIVQHLADGNFYDSTVNANNGTDNGTADVAGQVGRGRDFEASESDWVDFGDIEDVNAGSFTASIIYKFESSNTSQRLCQKRGTGVAPSAPGWQLSLYQDGNWGNTWVEDGTYGLQIPVGVTTGIENAVLHQADLVWDTSTGNLKLYIDGTQVSSVTDANLIGANLSNARNFTLGCAWDAIGTRSQYFDGVLDEFRFSDTNRSAAWVKATYYSSIDAIVTFGSELSQSSVTTYVTLTEPLGFTLSMLTPTLKERVVLANPLGFTLGMLTPTVGYRVRPTETLDFVLGLSATPTYVGRDLWALNSYITKLYEKESAIEKLTEKRSFITKLWEEDSSIR